MNVYVRRGSNYPVSEAGGNLTEVFREVELTDNSGTVPRAVHVFECGARPIAKPIRRSILFSEAWDLPSLLLAF
jgi:hypothetical protein